MLHQVDELAKFEMASCVLRRESKSTLGGLFFFDRLKVLPKVKRLIQLPKIFKKLSFSSIILTLPFFSLYWTFTFWKLVLQKHFFRCIVIYRAF